MAKTASNIRDKLNKKFGKEVVFSGDDEKFKLKRIPTGILSLDILLDGGVPCGRWLEIYGDYSTLKTSIACYAIANCQKLGFPALYCDVERSITPEFLKLRGVNLSSDMLDVVQMETGEQYIEGVKAYLDGGQHKVIVIDSIAAMLSNREERMAFENEPMGASAMMISRMTRVLTAVNKSNACIIMVNQTREKLQSFGDKVTTPGGKAPKFYAGQSIRLTKIKTEDNKKKRGEDRRIIGLKIVATLDKDKTSPNMGREVTIAYDVQTHDIDHAQEALGQGLMYGIIKRRGNTYYYREKGYSRKDILKRFKSRKILSRVQRLVKKEALKK